MDKIEYQNKILFVPEYPTIPVFVGDGVGQEIWESARMITFEAIKKCYSDKRGINWLEVAEPQHLTEETRNSSPDEFLETFSKYYVGLIGPMKTQQNQAHPIVESLRKKLDLYTYTKRIKWINGIVTPLRKPENINVTLFREISEDIYTTTGWKAGNSETVKLADIFKKEMKIEIKYPTETSFGVKAISKEGCERIVKSALSYATNCGSQKITIIHNAVNLPETEGSFLDWAYDLIEREYGERVFTMRKFREICAELDISIAKEALESALAHQKMIIDDESVDLFIKGVVSAPEKYSILITLNAVGDIVDNLLGALTNSRKLIPYAEINEQTGRAIFGIDNEPQIEQTGLNKANPSEMILACADLLSYLKWEEAARVIRKSIERIIAQGKVTEDLSHNFTNGIRLSTSEFTQEVIKMIRNI